MNSTVSKLDVSQPPANNADHSNFVFLMLGIQKMPVQWEKSSYLRREMALDKYPEYRNASKGAASIRQPKINIHRVLDYILGMNKEKCRLQKKQALVLNGGYNFGAEEYFENEAKMALRLANFISAFLQVIIQSR